MRRASARETNSRSRIQLRVARKESAGDIHRQRRLLLPGHADEPKHQTGLSLSVCVSACVLRAARPSQAPTLVTNGWRGKQSASAWRPAAVDSHSLPRRSTQLHLVIEFRRALCCYRGEGENGAPRVVVRTAREKATDATQNFNLVASGTWRRSAFR